MCYDVESLFEAGFLEGGEHPRRLGPTHEIPFLAQQDRWSFLRCGEIDPLSVEDFKEHNGFSGLEKAFAEGERRPGKIPDEALQEFGCKGRSHWR